jgi:hypothetical protein
VLDEDRILRLLRSVSDDLSVLGRESGADYARRKDPIFGALRWIISPIPIDWAQEE